MNQLRTSDLFRYKQQNLSQIRNYTAHKQKIKNIMNRSNQSIRYVSQNQINMLKKNNSSHEKAFIFKKIGSPSYNAENSRSISQVNQSFVSRMLENEKKRSKSIRTQINKGFSQILKVRENLMRNSLHSATSRISTISKDNQKLSRKLTLVRSSLSCNSFNKQYRKMAQISSNLSRFRIDTKNFKFLPKNQILLMHSSRYSSKQDQNISKSTSSLVKLPAANKKSPSYSNLEPISKKHLVSLVSPSNQRISLLKNVKLAQMNTGQIQQTKQVKAKFNEREIIARLNPETIKFQRKRTNK